MPLLHPILPLDLSQMDTYEVPPLLPVALNCVSNLFYKSGDVATAKPLHSVLFNYLFFHTYTPFRKLFSASPLPQAVVRDAKLVKVGRRLNMSRPDYPDVFFGVAMLANTDSARQWRASSLSRIPCVATSSVHPSRGHVF